MTEDEDVWEPGSVPPRHRGTMPRWFALTDWTTIVPAVRVPVGASEPPLEDSP